MVTSDAVRRCCDLHLGGDAARCGAVGERASLCPRTSRARASSSVAANSEPTTTLRPTPVLLRSTLNAQCVVDSSTAEGNNIYMLLKYWSVYLARTAKLLRPTTLNVMDFPTVLLLPKINTNMHGYRCYIYSFGKFHLVSKII